MAFASLTAKQMVLGPTWCDSCPPNGEKLEKEPVGTISEMTAPKGPCGRGYAIKKISNCMLSCWLAKGQTFGLKKAVTTTFEALGPECKMMLVETKP